MYIPANLETMVRQAVHIKRLTANYNRMRSALHAIELEMPNVTKHLEPESKGWNAALGIMDFIDSILDRDAQQQRKMVQDGFEKNDKS